MMWTGKGSFYLIYNNKIHVYRYSNNNCGTHSDEESKLETVWTGRIGGQLWDGTLHGQEGGVQGRKGGGEHRGLERERERERNAERVRGTCRWGRVSKAFDSRQNQPNQISHFMPIYIYIFFIHLNATFISLLSLSLSSSPWISSSVHSLSSSLSLSIVSFSSNS